MITRTNNIACFTDLINSIPKDERIRIAWHFTGNENEEVFPKKDDNTPELDNITIKTVQLLAYAQDELIFCEQEMDVMNTEIRDLLGKIFKTPKFAFVPCNSIVFSNGVVDLNC